MVTVIIVNWNAGRLLRDCIESIVANHAGLIAKVVIVDNGSTDRSLALLDQSLEKTPFGIEIVLNERNVGFGAACNKGAQLAGTEYLLFLNPDTRLFAGTMRHVVDFMRTGDSADVGIVGVKLVDENGEVARSCCRFPTLGSFLVHMLAMDRIALFRHMGMHMHEWEHDSIRDVDQVIGAFYFLRHDLFRVLGGFDERFFVYFEDLDLSMRMRGLGYRSVYLSSARAFHLGGGTSRQVKALRLFYSLRGRMLYGFKHMDAWRAWTLLLLTVTVEPITRSCLALIRRSRVDLQATWKAHGLLVLDLANILRSRRRP